jgi:Tfp pilus assembly protein PilX
MKNRITAEHGSALVTALLLTMIMLTVGLAGLAQVDVQQEQSGVERVRETTFNLGEGVLNAQIFALSQNWRPLRAAGAAPVVFAPCDQDSPEKTPNCPSADTISKLFASPDTEAPPAWRTEVRDNATTVPPTCSRNKGTTFYSDASTSGQHPFDCNDDGKLWVRAQATVRGRTRAVVALVQAERETYELPRAALLAGSLKIGNSGNKVLIDPKADTALSTGILLRCPFPSTTTPCSGYPGDPETLWQENKKLPTQLNGTKPQTNYGAPPVLSDAALEELRRTAITNGTYYSYPDCPSGATDLEGEIVWVTGCGDLAYSGNTSVNEPPKPPGALILENGTIEFKGNTTFNGLLYHVNQGNATGTDPPLVKLTGNNGVKGAVFVEGQGGFEIQGSAYLTVNGAAFDALRSYGSAGIIQNTWREITPGS